MHWAHEYIGKPWAADADGPCAFSCWGLVRHIFRSRYGVDLPHVEVGESGAVADGNVAAMKAVARRSGFRRPTEQRPADGDFVLLRTPLRLHCALVVLANSRMGVLESSHSTGVIWQPWAAAIKGMQPELWRRVT